VAKKIVKKVDVAFVYNEPPLEWYFFVGQRYYKRIQPTPYCKSKLPEQIIKYAKQIGKIHTQ